LAREKTGDVENTARGLGGGEQGSYFGEPSTAKASVVELFLHLIIYMVSRDSTI
jgi:hypothetical protein